MDDKGTQGNSKICTTTTTTTTILTATSRTDTGTTRTIRGDACSSRAHGDTRAQANVESTRPQNSRRPRQRTTRHHMSCGRIRPGPDPKYGAKGFPRRINHGELKLQANNNPGASQPQLPQPTSRTIHPDTHATRRATPHARAKAAAGDKKSSRCCCCKLCSLLQMLTSTGFP